MGNLPMPFVLLTLRVFFRHGVGNGRRASFDDVALTCLLVA
jgi:hypothetical protein